MKTKTTYTRDQKKVYFNDLRSKWQANKIKAGNDATALDLFNKLGLQVSFFSFYFTLQSMKANQFDGVPYIDCKTYQKWIDSGFRVRKGEQSKIDGLAWVDCSKDDSDEINLYPKIYKLFHKSQVEPIQ